MLWEGRKTRIWGQPPGAEHDPRPTANQPEKRDPVLPPPVSPTNNRWAWKRTLSLRWDPNLGSHLVISESRFISAWWDPEQRIQLTCAWTPDPWKLWDRKVVLSCQIFGNVLFLDSLFLWPTCWLSCKFHSLYYWSFIMSWTIPSPQFCPFPRLLWIC